MMKLLMGSAAVATALLLMQPESRAAIIADLGINPRSDNGDFSNSVGGGAFEDQYTFLLVNGPQHIAIANVTNVFPAPTDFITNFQSSVWTTGLNGIVNDGDDVIVIGPVLATQGCGPVANCQFAAGTAILNNGSFYLEFTGIGGNTSGYGGNLSTFAVPSPVAGAGLPGLILALGGLIGWRRWKHA